MTMIVPEKETCAVCGVSSKQHRLLSTNSFGSPDLDMRPPMMRRSTMFTWVKECPNCGYVANSLEDESPVSQEFLKSEAYRECDYRKFSSDLAVRFYRFYMIHIESEQYKQAFFDALHAAWACDDSFDEENAVFCRKKALIELEGIIESDPNCEDNYALKADLLRRSGQFDRLIAEFSGRTFSRDILNSVIAFQLAKAAKRDDACYLVEDAVNYAKKKKK